jgi:hypothetical protein
MPFITSATFERALKAFEKAQFLIKQNALEKFHKHFRFCNKLFCVIADSWREKEIQSVSFC